MTAEVKEGAPLVEVELEISMKPAKVTVRLPRALAERVVDHAEVDDLIEVMEADDRGGFDHFFEVIEFKISDAVLIARGQGPGRKKDGE